MGHLPRIEFWHSGRKQSASEFCLFWVSTCWWKDESNCSTNNSGSGKPKEYFHSSPVPGTPVFPHLVDCCLPFFYKPFWSLLSPVPDCGMKKSTDWASVRSDSRYKVSQVPKRRWRERKTIYVKRKHIIIIFKDFLGVLRANNLKMFKIATGLVIFVTQMVGN